MSEPSTRVLKESDNGQVLVLTEGKKKKVPRYSKNRRLRQELGGAVLSAVRRITKGVDKGLDTYIERREDSAAKKKDGAVKDRFRNLARAARTFTSNASEAPAEFLEQVADMKIGRRIGRRVRKMRILR
jgi:DNA topoisomerase VI subunit B